MGDQLPAIDVHGHFGEYPATNTSALKAQWMTGDAAIVAARARSANIRYTVVSPLLGLLPRGEADAVAGNIEARRTVEAIDGLLQWVVVNPLQPATFDQAREMLSRPKCVGIKIHPEEHGYRIADQGATLFAFAAELGTVILTHSGEANSRPADYVPFADDFPEVRLILAHLGNCGDAGNTPEIQVRAIQASRRGNIYTDTSSAQSILPGLIEWAVREIGAEKILFGTDTPLYFSPSQRARIDYADLKEEEKRKILWDNAQRILKIPVECQT
jgi:uncharacterized protein